MDAWGRAEIIVVFENWDRPPLRRGRPTGALGDTTNAFAAGGARQQREAVTVANSFMLDEVWTTSQGRRYPRVRVQQLFPDITATHNLSGL